MLNLEALAALAAQFQSELSVPVREFSLGGRIFQPSPAVSLMGVINLSADSWYRESVCLGAEAAMQRGRVLHAQGAHLIDLGAESTLSKAARVDEIGQQSMLLPVVRELAEEGILVSVETYLPEVTRACLDAGAKVLNLTGSESSAEMYRMVADQDAAVILCYVQGPNVREVADFDFGADPVASMYEYFARQIEVAERNGVSKIWVDPGLGFYYRNLQDSSVRIQHQMRTFLNTFRLRKLGYPTCHALPHAFECFGEEVRSAEPFFAVLAALGKTDLFRTHEVARTKAVLDTLGLWKC